MALDDDAVVAAVRSVYDRGREVTALRVALELALTDDNGDLDEATAREALRRLADAGRVIHQPVIVEWMSNPASREVLDFYRPR